MAGKAGSGGSGGIGGTDAKSLGFVGPRAPAESFDILFLRFGGADDELALVFKLEIWLGRRVRVLIPLGSEASRTVGGGR